MEKPRVYISGKVTGLPIEEAKRIFQEAEDKINATGKYTAVNPLKEVQEPNQTWAWYMKKDIELLMRCDLIYRLPNWRDSEGAKLENMLAHRLLILGLYDFMID